MANPIANNDIYNNANENQVLDVNDVFGVIANDSDAAEPGGANDPLRVTQVVSGGTTTNVVGAATDDTTVTLASGATLEISPDGSFNYDPRAAFQGLGRGETGTDFFEYRIEDDANEASGLARVDFEIAGRNDAPTTVADATTIDEIGPATLSILNNDSDADTNDTFDVSRFSLVEFKINGVVQGDGGASPDVTVNGFEQEDNIVGFGDLVDYTISVSEGGDVVFTPGDSIKDALEAGDVGEITFEYVATDDSGAGNADSVATTVTITIDGLDPAPQFLNMPGMDATLFVDSNNNEVTGRGFFAGEDYDVVAGRALLSNTDGSADPNDIIVGTDGDDALYGGLQGTDKIEAKDGNDIIGLRSGRVVAGDGADFVFSAAEGGNLNVNLGAGFDNLWSLADTSVTNAGGGGGFYGYSDGNDTLTAGGGDDFVYDIEGQPSGGVKTLTLGGGNNKVSLGDITSSTIVTLNGMDAIDLEGGRHDINTGDGNDIVFIASGADDDIVNTGAGNDFVQISDGNDVVTAGTGEDTVFAGGGIDTIFGGGDQDFLYGQAGNDFLFGGTEDDFLFGGAGINEVTGGAGNDVFALEVGGTQAITDFNLLSQIGPLSLGDRIGLTGGLTFDDLSFNQLGVTSVTLQILAEGEQVGVVQNIDTFTAGQLPTQAGLYTTV